MLAKRLSLEAYQAGILAQDRIILSKAITLIESQLAEDKKMAQQLLTMLIQHLPTNTIRIGVTGVPGVGKSTFIETFGTYLMQKGKKVAVLAIDPSSQLSKGSILGDKTRMEKLANHPMAYIRPSPAGGSLGGVAHKTRETITLLEAAGYEIIIVETVGVGQSETLVKDMTDFFLLLMLSGAGDELQGIKRGIMEMADAIVIHKADGENIHKSRLAQVAYQNALHLMPAHEAQWQVPVKLVSSLTGAGIETIAQTIEQYRKLTQANNFWQLKRQRQQKNALHERIQQYLQEIFYQHPIIKQMLANTEKEVIDGKTSISQAVHQLLANFTIKT